MDTFPTSEHTKQRVDIVPDNKFLAFGEKVSQIPPLEALLVSNLSHLPIFEEKRFSSNLCNSIKDDVMLAELWSDRSKGWLWAWSWPWPWSNIG